MTQQNLWTHIFTLFAGVVLSDDFLIEEEADSFSNAINDVCLSMGLGNQFTHSFITKWLTHNQDHLRALLTSPLREAKFTDVILALSEFNHKELLLENMQAIAMSDNCVHEKEFDLVILTSALWGVMPSRFFKQDCRDVA